MLLANGCYFISFANKIHLQPLLFSFERSAVTKVTLDQFLDRLKEIQLCRGAIWSFPVSHNFCGSLLHFLAFQSLFWGWKQSWSHCCSLRLCSSIFSAPTFHNCISLSGSALHRNLLFIYLLWALHAPDLPILCTFLEAVQQLLDPAFQLLFPNEFATSRHYSELALNCKYWSSSSEW